MTDLEKDSEELADKVIQHARRFDDGSEGFSKGVSMAFTIVATLISHTSAENQRQARLAAWDAFGLTMQNFSSVKAKVTREEKP